jgi:hypothetical protein
MCAATAPSRRTVDSEVFRRDHQALTLHSYGDVMTRSSAWQALRRRKRSTRPAHTTTASVHLVPRGAFIITSERVRPEWLNDSKFEEWTSLEFRHLKPPSGEDWNR